MKKSIVFLFLIGFFFSACTKKHSMLIKNQATEPTAKGISYLALGDSYTIGESVPSNLNFPNQLVTALNNNNLKTEAPKIVARTGWTTDELISAIKTSSLHPKYDFVTLLIGVNNQYRGYDIDIYRKEFVELLETSIKYANNDPKKVFVLSIPDWGVTPFAQNNSKPASVIAAEIDAYNQINKEETAKLKANYLDITPISREAKDNKDLVANDGLHPSAKMYQRFIEKLTPLISSKL